MYYIPTVLNNASILITGANGFVGSRLCRKFADEGFHVTAGVRKSADLRLLDGLELEYRYGDVTHPDSLPEMVTGVDYVIHNAGVVKAKKPETFFAVNEAGTENLCDALLKYNPLVKKLVLTSSLAAAGPSEPGRPRHESDPPGPLTTYGESKLAGEKKLLSYSDKLDVVAVRPPGVYGPGDKELFALFQAVDNHIRPQIGSMSRRLQLVHVDDLCLGFFKAVTAETKSGAVYFIAEHESYSMKEMIADVVRGSGKTAIPLVIPGALFKLIAAASEFCFKAVGATPMLTREKTRELLASWEIDVSCAREELGFVSQIPFAEGAKQTYEWYRAEGWL